MTQNATVWRPSVTQLRSALAQSVRVGADAGVLHDWQPRYDEAIVAVAGVTGSVGTTAVGLALAAAAASAGPVRLVECSEAERSGLTAAAQREFGAGRSGWRRGEHGGVALIRRAPVDRLTPSTLPPATEDATLTVLDVGSLAGTPSSEQVTASHLADRWILIARPSVPCLRWLELSLALGLIGEPVAAFVGLSPSRWPRPLASAVQPRTRALLEAGRYVAFRHDRRLAVLGLTPDPLPASITASGRRLFTLLEGLSA